MNSRSIVTVALCLFAAATCSAAAAESQSERLRAIATSQTEASIAHCEALLAKFRVTKVNPKLPEGTLIGEGGFRTLRQKERVISEFEVAIEGHQKYLADIKAGKPLIWSPLNMRSRKVGSIGTIESIVDNGVDAGAFVVQVIDDENAIVRCRTYSESFGKDHLWAKMPTAGLVDGSAVRLAGVWEITGTKRFPTLNGGQRTIFLIEQVGE